MATLNRYREQTMRFLRDQRQMKLAPDAIDSYINRARREIAMNAECVRILPPTSGQIMSLTVASVGSGYSSSPTLTISTPDYPSGLPRFPNGAQATGTITVNSGTISSASIIYGGAGYFQPVVSVTDTSGSGATLTPVLTPMNLLNQGQEVYNFADVDLSQFPGVKEIYAVRGVSIIYSNYRYSLPCYSFSTYQAMIRQYPFQYQYVPTFCSQFGQGAGGSMYFYPLPSQTYQMDWDCQCIPLDLVTDGSPEAIPAPWTETVPYFAAYLAYMELQNMNAAAFYLDQYDKFAGRYSRYSRIGRVVNNYGRF